MTSEVHPPYFASASFPVSNDTAQPKFTPDELQELQKIIDFRDAVFAGKHPRFKPPPGMMASERSVASPESESPRYAPEQSKLPLRPQLTSGSSGKLEQQIDDVLLTKSDVLVRAENRLLRERIEKELKQQVEQKKIDMRLGIEVRDGIAVGEDDVDLEEVMVKAGIYLKEIDRPEDPASVGKLVGFYGDGPEEATERKKEVDHYEPPPNIRPAPLTGPSGQNGSPLPPRLPSANDGKSPSDRARDHEKNSVVSKEARFPASDSLRRAAMDGAGSQGTDQPRYVATASGVRSPAAPQPIRPANMARVESQDHIVELDASSGDGYMASRRRSPLATESGTHTPQPFVKSEPISPHRKDAPVRRPGSPGLHPYRGPQYEPRAPLAARAYEYDMPPTAAYGVPRPSQTHPAPPPRYPYESYGYREPYAAVPPEYPRPYASYGVPPPPIYYPPRGAYEDYDRYGSRPPPTMPRRSVSPSPAHANKRVRRSSRTPSPGRRLRQTPARSPTPDDRASRSDRGFSGPPGPPPVPSRRDERLPYERLPQARAEPHNPPDYRPFPPPPPRPYYDGRDPYYQPAPYAHPRYMEDPLAPRPESAVVPREGDYRSYRERDYQPPPAVRALPGPPPPSAYPPRPDYRAPSRALMGPPDMADYPPPLPPTRDYYGRPIPPPAHPHELPTEYGPRGASVHPPEERPYPVAREQSVRPEAPPPQGYYGDMGYRPASVRPPFVERNGRYDAGPPVGHTHPPPPPQPYPGYEEYHGRY